MKKYTWTEAQKLINSSKPTYVIFTNTWCGTCKLSKEMSSKLTPNYEDDMNFIEVNMQETGLALDPNNELQLMKAPTHIWFKNGKQRHRAYNFLPNQAFIDWTEDTIRN